MLTSFCLQARYGLFFCLVPLVSAGGAFGTPPEEDEPSCKMSLARGFLAVRGARFEAALERFEEAISGGGDCLAEAHLGLATTYNSMNDHKRALRAAETALLYAESEEVLAEVHYQIGLAFDQRGPRMTKKKTQALAAFEHALEFSDGEHRRAIRAALRICKEVKDLARVAEFEVRFPGVRVSTLAEQRRAVRPKKPPRRQEEAALGEVLDVPAIRDGQTFVCSTGELFESEDEEKLIAAFGAASWQGGSRPERNTMVEPKYPEEDRKEKVSGVVAFILAIDKEGIVRMVRIDRGLSEGLNRSTVDAVCRWRYEPARNSAGKAVACFLSDSANFGVP